MGVIPTQLVSSPSGTEQIDHSLTLSSLLTLPCNSGLDFTRGKRKEEKK